MGTKAEVCVALRSNEEQKGPVTEIDGEAAVTSIAKSHECQLALVFTEFESAMQELATWASKEIGKIV